MHGQSSDCWKFFEGEQVLSVLSVIFFSRASVAPVLEVRRLRAIPAAVAAVAVLKLLLLLLRLRLLAAWFQLPGRVIDSLHVVLWLLILCVFSELLRAIPVLLLLLLV